jgi:beta-lactamase regulating signal transducer with metallopeptidase domain/HEAT repeat protein
MNWLVHLVDPAAKGCAEILVGGLILSCGIYLVYRVLGPLLVNFPRGSAATTHRVLVLLFGVLALTPVLSCLKPFRQETARPAPRSFAAVAMTPEEGIPAVANIQPTQPSPNAPRFDRVPVLKWIGSVDWTLLLVASWLIAVSILVVRLIFSLYSLRTLHCRVRIVPFPPEVACRRRIELAESTLVRTPIAIGLWSPKVLLPPKLAAELSADDWRRVLRHEVAHLERYDDWSNFLQRLLIVLNPFNPFLWLVGNELQEVREIVCDDWVLAEFSHAESYAQLLARLAAGGAHSSALAAGASRAGRQLYKRLSRILDWECDRDLRPCLLTTLLAAIGLVASSAAAICVLPVVAFAPSVGAEQLGPPPEADSAPQSEGGESANPAQAGNTGAADPEIIALLKHSAETDNDPRVRDQAIFSLCAMSGDQATDALLQLLDESKDDHTKITVLSELDHGRISDPKVRDKLKEFAAGSEPLPVRFAALDQLAAAGDDSATDQFVSIYRSAVQKSTKEHCLRGLARIGSKASKDFLIATAKDDSDPEMRLAALRALTEPRLGGDHFLIGTDGVSLNGKNLYMVLREHLGRSIAEDVREKIEMLKERLRRSGLAPQGWLDAPPGRTEDLRIPPRAWQVPDIREAVPLEPRPKVQSPIPPPADSDTEPDPGLPVPPPAPLPGRPETDQGTELRSAPPGI